MQNRMEKKMENEMETGVDTTIILITKDLSSKMLMGPLLAAIIDQFRSGLVVRSLTATAGRIKWAPQSRSSDAQPGQQGICGFSGWGFLYSFLAQKDLHVYFTFQDVAGRRLDAVPAYSTWFLNFLWLTSNSERPSGESWLMTELP